MNDTDDRRRTVRGAISCLLIAALLPLGACTSMKTVKPVVTPGAPAFGPVKAGDTVRVDTAGGKRVRFVVQAVESDTLVAADGTRYSRADITRLQRQSFSGPKTAGLIGGIVGGFFLVLGMAFAAGYGDLLNGG